MALVAWLALAVSVVSLSWQIASWARSGPRLLVELVVSASGGGRVNEPATFTLMVTNVGRQATTVHNGRLLVGSRSRWHRRPREPWITEAPDAVRLPRRIEPGDELIVSWPRDDVDAALEARGLAARDLAGCVRIGHRWKYSPLTKHKLQFTFQPSPEAGEWYRVTRTSSRVEAEWSADWTS